MSRSTWLYIIAVLAFGLGLSVLSLLGRAPSTGDWGAFVVLALFATGSQLFKALFKSNHQSDRATTSYSPILIFLFAGALLLPPALFVLLAAVPHLVEWGKERFEKTKNLAQWYVQPFNIATHIICGLAAQKAFSLASTSTSTVQAPTELLAALAAAFVYVVLNHLMVGLALVLARGVTWQASGVLEIQNVLPDFIMLGLGFALALLWELNPWFILPALSPLVLIQRALMVPQLKKEAQVDPKTGLWNARHFAELFTAEFKRAKRFDRPMSLIMADLDLLRNINNTYGHLAGDNVLEGLGEIIRSSVREFDIPSRFGGEEFLIAMPESGPLEAIALAERLRAKVESSEFHGQTTSAPIRATISLGISHFPSDATAASDLIHAADVAVYQAKLKGRNCVILSSDVPHSIDLDSAIARERLAPSQVDAFISRPAELSTPDRPTAADRGVSVEPPHNVSGHLSRVAASATAIASELGLSPERVEQVRQAAFFHDIGKIGIPEVILHKPAKLSPDEYEKVKTHVVLGAEFLETCQELGNLAPFVRHHHEWWDGSGYPDHLHRERIPLEARILSVCDAVEAMASNRPYHRAMSLPEIIAELIRCEGTQFDPVVVQTLVRILEREGDRLVVNSAREVTKKDGHATYSASPPPEWVLPPELESPLADAAPGTGNP